MLNSITVSKKKKEPTSTPFSPTVEAAIKKRRATIEKNAADYVKSKAYENELVRRGIHVSKNGTFCGSKGANRLIQVWLNRQHYVDSTNVSNFMLYHISSGNHVERYLRRSLPVALTMDRNKLRYKMICKSSNFLGYIDHSILSDDEIEIVGQIESLVDKLLDRDTFITNTKTLINNNRSWLT